MSNTFVYCFTNKASNKLLANGYELLCTKNSDGEKKVWVFLNNSKMSKLDFTINNDFMFTNRMNF